VTKRTPKVLMAALGKIEPVAFSAVDWRRIEREFGQKVPPEVRKLLEDETLQFIAGSRFEKEAAPAEASRGEINKIRRAVEDLLKLLAPSRTLDGAHYAKHLLLNHLDDDRLGHLPVGNPLTALTLVLTSCVAACDSALNELRDPGYTIREGEAWTRWIRRLTKILRDHELPTTVAKSKGINDTQSPFVRLIACFQDRVPSECKRHALSGMAVAKAISAAQRD
jgi:hypothetical protein